MSANKLILGQDNCIKEDEFSGDTNIQHIVIAENITQIGGWAFSDCSALKTVEILSKVSHLGTVGDREDQYYDGHIFYGCKNLTDVKLPAGLIVIGEGIFKDCESLKSIKIPDGVTTIGDCAFANCKSLETVAVPKSVKSIGFGAFKGCVSLKTISLLGATSIGSSAFEGCESLHTINLSINNETTTVGSKVFAYCKSLKFVHTSGRCGAFGFGIQNTFQNSNPGLEKIGWYNLHNENGLVLKESYIGSKDWSKIDSCLDCRSIRIPETVKTLGQNRYDITGSWGNYFNRLEDCTSLVEVIIPEHVLEVGSGAFTQCKALKTVRLLGRSTRICSTAFIECKLLQSIIVPKGCKQFYSEQLQDNNLYTKVIEE